MDIKWDSYGDWNAIADAEDPGEIRAKILGNRQAWHPNYCPLAVTYALQYAREEFVRDHGGTPAALDFGCGFGRNAPLLQTVFPEIIGLDIPAMVARFQIEYPTIAKERYQHVYDSLQSVADNEKPCVLYDSVVL